MKATSFSLVLLCLAQQTAAFLNVPATSISKSRGAVGFINRPSSELFMKQEHGESTFDPLNLAHSQKPSAARKGVSAALAATLPIMIYPSIANAAGPDWGIFEGRTLSLLHPLMMAGLLTLSVNTALLGFSWRRQRTIGDDISALKKTLPAFEGSSLSAAIAAAQEAGDTSLAMKLNAALPIQSEIDALVQERKDLSSKGSRDKHYNQGALLAFLGTAFAIEGPLNTYARAGKLFPGPHLYAGAGLVVLWALAASCVPHMQRGNDTARTIHIAANLGGIGLFAWQVVSGVPILFKVIEFTKWP